MAISHVLVSPYDYRRFVGWFASCLPSHFSTSEILKILLRDEELASDVHLRSIAQQTKNFSGSDLKRSLFLIRAERLCRD